MTRVLTGAAKASDIMTLGAATVRENDTVLKAIELLNDHRISALPVLDHVGNLSGIVTEGDFLRREGFDLAEMLKKPLEMRRQELGRLLVRDIMTHICITTNPDMTLDDAIELMHCSSLKRLPVVAEGKLVGLLSRSDILRALVEYKP